MSIWEVRGFEEGYGIDINEWFVQMLEKKSVRNSDIFHHHLQLVYNLQRPILDQNVIKSFLGTVSFIQEFNFDKMVQEC